MLSSGVMPPSGELFYLLPGLSMRQKVPSD